MRFAARLMAASIIFVALNTGSSTLLSVVGLGRGGRGDAGLLVVSENTAGEDESCVGDGDAGGGGVVVVVDVVLLVVVVVVLLLLGWN